MIPLAEFLGGIFGNPEDGTRINLFNREFSKAQRQFNTEFKRAEKKCPHHDVVKKYRVDNPFDEWVFRLPVADLKKIFRHYKCFYSALVDFNTKTQKWINANYKRLCEKDGKCSKEALEIIEEIEEQTENLYSVIAVCDDILYQLKDLR